MDIQTAEDAEVTQRSAGDIQTAEDAEVTQRSAVEVLTGHADVEECFCFLTKASIASLK